MAQDELFPGDALFSAEPASHRANADIAPPPERTGSNAGAEPQADPASSPLAVRMRPRSLDEVVGQQHLLREGAPLRRLVEGAAPASVLLYGPPGTGKTTLANLVSIATGRRFVAMSALSAGVKEVRGVIEEARRRRQYNAENTVLFIDEVHRFSKTQQDALLGPSKTRCSARSRTARCCWSRRPPRTRRSPSSRRCCRGRWCCSCGRSPTTTSRRCSSAPWPTSAASAAS
ncbi:AAA family ATPase [Amycolatopsis vancoresmycina]|uniref:AAA family ATPase n=1 Tax=Amycolatopsis vancoresmycina TaxID=208444 RepID=UPI003B84B3C5